MFPHAYTVLTEEDTAYAAKHKITMNTETTAPRELTRDELIASIAEAHTELHRVRQENERLHRDLNTEITLKLALLERLPDPTAPASFESELSRVINRFSKERPSDTPDFILARFIAEALQLFHTTVKQREMWHGRDGNEPDPQPATKRGRAGERPIGPG